MTNIVSKHKNIALIVAAGSGSRMNTNIPKQYMQVKQKAILNYTLEKFYNHQSIDYVLCVISPEHRFFYDNLIPIHPKLLPVVYGGETRQDFCIFGFI